MAAVSDWVRRFAPLVGEGEVLDLACGGGRHARHFAERGHRVLALDRDLGALTATPAENIVTMQFDLEDGVSEWPFAAGRFAGIVVTNYLHRPLFSHLASSLAADGVLIYETFAIGNAAFGKPSNPDFLLQEGELLALAASYKLRVIAYEEGVSAFPKPAMVQRIVATGPAFPRSGALLELPQGREKRDSGQE